MDVTTLSDADLKALGYDQMKLLQQTQANLLIIEQEIAKRAAAKVANDGNTEKV